MAGGKSREEVGRHLHQVRQVRGGMPAAYSDQGYLGEGEGCASGIDRNYIKNKRLAIRRLA